MTRREGTNDLRGGLDAPGARAAPGVGELRLLRALDSLDAQLRTAGDTDKVLRTALREAALLLRPDHRCAAILTPGDDDAGVILCGVGEPGADSWPALELARFARGEKVTLPGGIAAARLKRRGRGWGALALRWASSPAGWESRHALTRVAGVVNECLERLERDRLALVRSRIDRKIMEQRRPKDLLYHILDGLRSLTNYDHSGAILLVSPGRGEVELAAEQLAFRKGRSPRIGATLRAPDGLGEVLASGRAWGYARAGHAWRAWEPSAPPDLPGWLEHDLPGLGDGALPAGEVICCPLRTGDSLTGLIRLAAVHPGSFGPYEGALVETFAPHAVIALQNARRVESIEEKMIQAERKHAMAELARGVSHDVNNALGAVLPLVQQMHEEARTGAVDVARHARDLESIEGSLRTCTRIFGGMLRFARRSAGDVAVGRGQVSLALDAAMAILGEGLRRHAIALSREIDDALPDVPVGQGELDQILLNLVGNARDAIVAAGRGGTLRVSATLAPPPRAPADPPHAAGAPPWVLLDVTDDGVGIEPRALPQVLEPFFTTKPGGNGLGLAICRSIIWQAGGRIDLASPAHQPPSRPGTRVRILLPSAGGRA